MKRISKKLLYCLLLAFIFVLNSCEKEQYEDTKDTKNAVKVYYLTGKKAEDIATKLGGTLNKTLSDKGTTFKAGDGVTVDYSSIMVVDNGTDIAYSLKADSNAETDLIFQNVVMEEKDNETVTKLITYKMSPQFATDYVNDLRDISQFRGEVTITNLSGRDACHPEVEIIPFDDSLPIITLPTAGNTGGGGSSNGQGGGGNNGTGPAGSNTGNGSSGSGYG